MARLTSARPQSGKVQLKPSGLGAYPNVREGQRVIDGNSDIATFGSKISKEASQRGSPVAGILYRGT